MYESEAKRAWTKENTVFIGLKLMKSTDADILSTVLPAKSKQGEIKRLIRLGMEYEKVLKVEKSQNE